MSLMPVVLQMSDHKNVIEVVHQLSASPETLTLEDSANNTDTEEYKEASETPRDVDGIVQNINTKTFHELAETNVAGKSNESTQTSATGKLDGSSEKHPRLDAKVEKAGVAAPKDSAEKQSQSNVTEKKPFKNTKHPLKNVEAIKQPLRDEPSSNSAYEVKEIAQKLFDEQFVLISPEEYTQFLAANDAESSAIRDCYMNLFEWDASLIKATRMLCLKLYLKGESQEIDRILSAFTKAYLKQHPVNVFCTQNFEQIYIVLYSLILLNTSLHNAEVSKRSRLSQADYIRNTLSTFLQQSNKSSPPLTIKQKIKIERELNSYYDDLLKEELALKQRDVFEAPKKEAPNNRHSVADTIFSTQSSNRHELEAPPSHFGNKRAEADDLYRQRSNTSLLSTDPDMKAPKAPAITRMTSIASNGSTNSTFSNYSSQTGYKNGANSRFGFTRALINENKNYRANPSTSLRNCKSTDQLRHVARRSSRSSIHTKESAFTLRDSGDDAFSMLSFNDMAQIENSNLNDRMLYRLEHFNISDFQDPLDLKLELEGAPYLKEGLLKLRIINNDMVDHLSSEEPAISSASLAVSVLSSRSGFFSFFLRSSGKPAPPTTLGTNNHHVFGNKFTEYFVVVSKGELRLYSFDPKVVKKHKQQKARTQNQKQVFRDFEAGAEEEEDLGDGNWLKNAAHIGNYNLCSTIAQLERGIPNQSSIHNGPQKVQFSLLFPRVSKKPQKKFLFEAGTMEVATEFVHTCNFWASKLTAVPTLEESVSSIEYGWSNLDALINMGDSFKKTKAVSKWEPFPKGVYLSNFTVSNGHSEHEGLMKQFVQTVKYYNHLKDLFNNFNHEKARFIKYFRRYSSSANYKLIAQNYEARSEEYKAELNKYKSYITMLGFGLKLRFDAEREEQLEAWIDDISSSPDAQSPEAMIQQINKRKEEAAKKESELTKAVKSELGKLMKVSGAMRKLVDERHEQSQDVNDPASEFRKTNGILGDQDEINASIVKSPKTFSLAQLEDTQSSPINQLLSADRSLVSKQTEHASSPLSQEMIMSYSTNTITEEDEPEE